MNITYIKLVFIIIALILTFSTFYLNSSSVSWATHERQIDQLREVRLLDALSNQEILRVRYQLFYNYDSLSEYIIKLNTAITLLTSDSYIHLQNTNNILIYKNLLLKQLYSKIQLIEKFKSSNSLLKSTLVSFPKIANDTQSKLTNTRGHQKLVNYLDSLVNDILLYSLINDSQLDKKMRNRVTVIKNWKISNSKGLEKILTNTVQQAQFIIEQRHQVNKIVLKLMSMPIVELTRNLQDAYLTQHELDIKRNDQFRNILFVISLILLAYTGYILVKFKRKGLELAQEKDRAFVTLQSIGDGVIATDALGIVDFINPVAEKLTGYQNDHAKGNHLHKFFRVLDEHTNEPITDLVEKCISEQQRIGATEKSVLMNKSGEAIAIEECVAPIKGTDNNTIGAIIVFRDVSGPRELRRKLLYQATHDSLTGVINRRAFDNKLNDAMFSAKKFHIQHTLLYLDLDQFKVVNDTCGHDAGDQLLIQITSLLQTALSSKDTLARLGGDEFGILLENCPLERSKIFASIILNKIKRFKFVWQGISFQLGTSIGIVIIDKNNENAVSSLSAADMACYVAKDSGRNRFHVFNTNDTELMQRQGEMQWVSRLMQAFKDGNFVLYRQPVNQLLTPTSNTNHYELLIRLKQGNSKLILPSAFIPAAERYNIMPIIDRWVIHTAFEQCFQYETDAQYAINLSGTSLNSENLLEFIKSEFKAYSIPPQQICFEITETAAINNLRKAARLIGELKQFGFKFALDDFGKGLSSYTYLSNLPVDYLKIDGEFVANMRTNPVYWEIIKSVNHISHLMGMHTIAECVEDDETLNILKDMGIDFAQGFAYGPPEPLAVNWTMSSNAVLNLQ